MATASRIRLESNAVLFEPGQHVEVVDFPRTCVVSLITQFRDGSTVEVASVGNEGIVGVPIRLGGSLAVQAMCSVAGWSDRIQATTFTHEVENDPDFREVVDDYLRAVFNQLSQAVACNRLHSTTERLARWLLASGDRIGDDEIAITYRLLSQLLGSSEATVRRCSTSLHAAGLITSQQGHIAIVDRPGLEAIACECYAAIKTEVDAVIRRARIRFRSVRPLSLRD